MLDGKNPSILGLLGNFFKKIKIHCVVLGKSTSPFWALIFSSGEIMITIAASEIIQRISKLIFEGT
jgi:hypothetical protein